MAQHPRKTGNYSTSKRSGPDKAECQYFHARKRAKERLGIDLTEDQYDSLVACIKNPDKASEKGVNVEFIEDQTNRRTAYRVTMHGIDPFEVVFDNYRKTIITFLHPLPDGVVAVHRYYDRFGNVHSTKDEWIDTPLLNLNTNELTICGHCVEYVGTEMIGGKPCKKWKLEDGGRYLVYLPEEKMLSEMGL